MVSRGGEGRGGQAGGQAPGCEARGVGGGGPSTPPVPGRGGSDAPLRVGLVLAVPGMPDHPALPNDGVWTGYPHALEHQPAEPSTADTRDRGRAWDALTHLPQTTTGLWGGRYSLFFLGLLTAEVGKASPSPCGHVSVGKRHVPPAHTSGSAKPPHPHLRRQLLKRPAH